MLNTRLLGLGLILVGLTAVSCASDNQQAQRSQTSVGALTGASSPLQSSDTRAAQPRVTQAVASNQPLAPKGAQYTIYCYKMTGADHVAMAEKIRKDLTAQTEFKQWHVIHQASESLLYYGFYKSIDEEKDKKEAERAQLDRKKISLMTDQMGNKPFGRAVIVALESPDPLAPPEWNLANAPGDYSLQIGTYKDSPQRKEAAIEAVREARKVGIEAYYHHGPTQSSVCVGHWPKEAIREDISKPRDPNKKIMVAPDSNDPRVIAQYQAMAASKDAELVTKKTVVVDPTLMAAMKQYPYNTINGEVVKRVENGENAYVSSVLVPTRDKSTATAGTEAGAPTGAAAVRAAQDQIFQSQPRTLQSGTNAPPQPSSSGVLRGIGN